MVIVTAGGTGGNKDLIRPEQNPDLTNKNVWQLLSRIWQTPEPIQKFETRRRAQLVTVRLNILTRKTLGGLQTDLQGRVHGYRSLEGTFLGGCLFSGRQAGRAAAAAL